MKVLAKSGFAEGPFPTLQMALFLSNAHMEKNTETKQILLYAP